MNAEWQDDRFKLELSTPQKTDIYLSRHNLEGVAWPLVRALDQDGIRAIGDVLDLKPDKERTRRIVSDCSGLIAVLPSCEHEPSTTSPELLDELRLGAELGLPLAIFREESVRLGLDQTSKGLRLQFGDSEPILMEQRRMHGLGVYPDRSCDLEDTQFSIVDHLRADVLRKSDGIPPYAFLIGRLERDFAHAREAIRIAVESEAGIPCIWSDHGHQTNIESVHRRTQLLIKHATFVIADLSLGSESPKRENPSRAHEIGMSIAYNRKLMLCSQEPRRYPYFSIGDMQMVFWSNESELESKVREWINANRESVGRTVFNQRLSESYPDYEPKIRKPVFTYDPKLRYVGPGARDRSPLDRLKALMGSKSTS